MDGGLPQAALIAQGLGKGFRVAQIVEDPSVFSERRQGITQVKPEIDGLRQRVLVLGEVLQGHQRLLEGGHCLAIGRAHHRLGPRLPAVGHGLVPHLAPVSMVRQSIDLLDEPLRRQPFEGCHNAGMERAPPLLEDTPIGHFVRQGVLEGVFQVREQARFVEELGRLQMRQAHAKRLVRHLGNGLEQRQGHLRADHRRRLQQALLLRRQPVDARREHRLHRGWHLHGGQGSGQTIGAALPHQHPGFDQRPHAFFQEKRIAPRALDEELL